MFFLIFLQPIFMCIFPDVTLLFWSLNTFYHLSLNINYVSRLEFPKCVHTFCTKFPTLTNEFMVHKTVILKQLFYGMCTVHQQFLLLLSQSAINEFFLSNQYNLKLWFRFGQNCVSQPVHRYALKFFVIDLFSVAK